MQRKPNLIAVLLLIGLLLFQGFAPDLQAQTAPPTPQQLDQLLAPIALYPDSLLAQITMASTNPQEILDVDNWLAQNQNLAGTALTDAAQQQGFDPAFISLVNFPTVLEMMAEHIDDYAAIGQAVSADQGAVSASIQRLRSQAYASGALRSNQQQQVEVQQSGGQPVYVIQPASPQVVYLPQYDPTVVYAGPGMGGIVAAPLLSFGVGIGIGALLIDNQPWGWGGWGWNWGGRRIYYNRGPWGGWNGGYRPPRPWYRPRPVMYGNRPGYGGNWRYRPRNYRPPSATRRPGSRPALTRPGSRPGYNRPGSYNRPGNRPASSRPTVRPGNNRPVNRPGNGNRPAVQPVRPGTPNTRPNVTRPTRPNVTRPPQNRPIGNRPANTPRPRPQNRPVQQNRPAPQNRPARPAGNGPAGQTTAA